MNAATNQPSILTLRLGQSDQAGHIFRRLWSIDVFMKERELARVVRFYER